jgi:transcription termination/antitermination protein NusA
LYHIHMASEITKAIKFLSDEKGLDHTIVMEALEIALAAAFRKDFGNRQQNVQVKFDPETGDMVVWDEKLVVEDIAEDVLEKAQEELADRREVARKEERELTEEEVADLPHYNPKSEIMISEAKEHQKKIKVGETIKIDLEVPGDFGRMAAQTAKQVIIQKVREAERNNVFDDFKDQEHGVVQGTISRKDRTGNTLVDLGKITGILPIAEQVQGEFLRPGTIMQFYVVSVAMGKRGPEIMLSRSSNKMVETVFDQEIPEIGSGEVIIKSIARDPGRRAKVAVHTEDENIDPIGSCIGQRGSRITTIINELGGEKIDVIQWNDNAEEFIKQALSPAKVDRVELNDETKEAKVFVAGDQFSLAIGRGGQNVRLAAALTGWKIDVEQEGGEVVESEDGEESTETSEETSEEASEEKTEEAVEEKVEEAPKEEVAEEATEETATEEAPEEESAEETEEEKKDEAEA